MSGKLVNEVLEHAPGDLTPAQMLVLISLAEDAREKGPNARRATFESSVEDIVRRTRLKHGTVRNALAELVGRGLLVPLNGRVQRGTVQHYALPALHEHHRGASTTPVDDEAFVSLTSDAMPP